MADVESYSVTPASNTGEFPEGQAPSTVNDGGRQVQADVKIAHNRINGDITAGGTADALTATFSPVHTAHVAGRVLVITAAAANATTTPTFTLDGLAAKTITKNGGQALVAGDIYGAGHELILKDAGTYYELMNPAVTNLTGLTSTVAEINALDLTTGAGTAEASKAVVLDGSKDIATINSLTATSTVTTNFTLGGTAITATGAELNITDADSAASIFSSAGELSFNTASTTALTINTSQNIGIGISSPDTRLHAWKGSAGTVTAATNTVATIENSTSGYISFLTPNTASSGIYFGDPDNNAIGSIVYNHLLDQLLLRVGGSLTATLDGNGNILTGGAGTISGTPTNSILLNNGTEPSALTANGTVLYAKDSSDGTSNSTLGIRTEQSVETIGTFTASHKAKLWWNGVEYWIQLDAV